MSILPTADNQFLRQHLCDVLYKHNCRSYAIMLVKLIVGVCEMNAPLDLGGVRVCRVCLAQSPNILSLAFVMLPI